MTKQDKARFGTVEYVTGNDVGAGVFVSPHAVFRSVGRCLLFCVRTGRMTVFVGKEAREASAGQAVWIDAGRPHAAEAEGEVLLLSFPRSVIDGFADGTLASPVVPASYGTEKTVLRVMRALERRDGNGAVCEIAAAMAAIFAKEPLTERKINAAETRLRALLSEAERRAGNLPFESAATFMRMTPAYFSRYFKSMSGVTYSTYLNRLRVANAAAILDRGKTAVSELSKTCGFATLRNFNRAFKEATGFAPRRLPRGYFLSEPSENVEKPRKTPKIAVVYTGGTIGSSVSDGIVAPYGNTRGRLVSAYNAESERASFTEFSPVEMLSENVQPDDLYAIARCIEEADGYDGVIVTHGTDTMTFTANLLAQLFAGSGKTVVLTGALRPLSDPDTDGYGNFAAAADFIRTGLPGVFVAFGSPDGSRKIHLASRLTTARQIDGAFGSMRGIPFGEMIGGRFARNAHPYNPSPEELSAARPTEPVRCRLCTDILTVVPHALTDFSRIRESETVRAVVAQAYHSGTVCTAGKETDFTAFAARWRARGVPVVLAPVDPRANVYESVRGRLTDAIAAPTSFENAVVKVMLALGNGLPPEEFLRTQRWFEHLSHEQP